jgi:acetoin utilization deacetylase AcuC-like enzyme
MKWEKFKFFFTDHIQVPLPEGHRFPMEKYRLLHEAVLREGVMQDHQLLPAPLASKEELLAINQPPSKPRTL